MDVIEIDGASNNSVNDVRQIRDEVLFPPQVGRYKVYIIDEVHMLTGSAFNALLKTIEEPPPYIVFIFATTELHKVPATIKSRCQQFNFRLIPVETIQEILKKVCADTGVKAEDDALFWIARESTGSLRDAFTLFDQVSSFSEGSIRSDLIREKLGLVGLEKLNALAEACAVNDAPAAFTLTDEILASGVAIEQFVIDLAGYYRSLLLLKNGVTRESLLGYRMNLFSAKVLEAFDSIRLEQALDLLLDCYRDIRYSVSPRFELETVISRLSWLSKWISQPELKNALDDARISLRANVSPNSGSQTGKPANNTAKEGIARPLAPAAVSAPVVSGAPVVDAGQTQCGVAPEKVRPSAPVTDSVKNPSQQQLSGGARSLSDDFRRMIAARENGEPVNEGEDDVPLWDRVVRKKDESAADAPDAGHNEQEISPQVDRLLRLIPGTVVP